MERGEREPKRELLKRVKGFLAAGTAVVAKTA